MKLHQRSYGAGQPLVLLHGLFGSSNNWHSLAGRLADKFHVFAVDLRNHGDSPHSDEFGYPEMVEDLREFLGDQKIPRVSLLGHSMGGKTAMEFALRCPLSVERLIVVDISPRVYPPGHDRIFDALTGLDLSRYETRAAIEAALEAALPDPRVRQFLLTNLKRHHGGRYTWRIDLDTLRSRYGNIQKGQESPQPFLGPTMFIAGEKSNHIQPSDIPLITRLFPRAILRTVAGAGHWVHADAPAEFYRLLMEFLES